VYEISFTEDVNPTSAKRRLH